MIMKRIDSDDRDDFEAVPDFFASWNAESSIEPFDSRSVGYMYRGVPQDRNANICDWTADKLAPLWPAQSG